MQGVVAAANQDPRLARVFSTFTADQPRRSGSTSTATRRRRWASTSPTCSTRCRRRLAAIYVNDFNLFGRTWQVNLQADAAGSQRYLGDLPDLRAQHGWARWCRCARSRTSRIVLGPQVISRFNNYRAVTINGGPAPGVSSGDALAGMEQVSAKTLAARLCASNGRAPPIRRQAASGQTVAILSLAVLFAYPVPGGAVRELDDPDSGAAVGDDRRARRLRRHVDFRPGARSLCADRPRRADRAGGEERHSDRRVRQGAARGRHADPARRRRWARASGSVR